MSDYERTRADPAERGRRLGLAALGARTSATAPGAPSARTTAPTATPGTSCRTTWPAARPTAGARTASPASATATSSSCFAPAFWNGRDPILKERLFGLTSARGQPRRGRQGVLLLPRQHADALLHEVPLQVPAGASSPTAAGRGEPARATAQGLEFELLDTGVFDEDRYFDIVIEYAKADARGHLHPDRGVQPRARARRRCTSCRTSGSATPGPGAPSRGPEPAIRAGPDGAGLRQPGRRRLATSSRCRTSRSTTASGRAYLYAAAGRRAAVHRQRDERAARLRARATQPQAATSRTRSTATSSTASACVNPAQVGTKAALHYRFDACPPAARSSLRLRLADDGDLADPLDEVDAIVAQRRREADEFYAAIHPPKATDDERLDPAPGVRRPALDQADLPLRRRRSGSTATTPTAPPPASRRDDPQPALAAPQLDARACPMPDKWEYPWFAAWDLAFHCVALALVDPEFAKEQLWLLLFEQFQHPNGQIPAYEWEFSDLNPPVHAWAVWRVYNMDRIRTGKADRDFLETLLPQAAASTSPGGSTRSTARATTSSRAASSAWTTSPSSTAASSCRDGAVLEQSDATGWMGMFCLNLMRIALELAKENRVYEGLATKFFQHYVYVGAAMKHMGGRDYQLWDEQDGFFYDVLRYPDGRFHKFRVRSLVGLIPLFAVERLEEDWIEPFQEFRANLDWFLKNRRDLVEDVRAHRRARRRDDARADDRRTRTSSGACSSASGDPDEFLSDYGIRSLSKAHEQHPFAFDGSDGRLRAGGGGVEDQGRQLELARADLVPDDVPDDRVAAQARQGVRRRRSACRRPAAGQPMTFHEMAREIADRLIRIFTRDADGPPPRLRRHAASSRTTRTGATCILFYEYFHGDNGAGLGASHQTGWTALVASLIDEWRR